jgi:hypothetical protein
MIRFMDLYWDFFVDATLMLDKDAPYWAVSMRRPSRRTEVVQLRPDSELKPLTIHELEQKES